MQALLQKTHPLRVVKNTTVFSDQSFEMLDDRMHEKQIQPGERIFWEGGLCEQLFLMKEGIVRMSKMSETGNELTLHYFYPGDLFGEQNQESLFSAEAVTSCVIGAIRQDDLEQLISECGAFAIEFSKWLSQMQSYTQLKLRDLLFHGKNGALASTIIRAANTYGVQDGEMIHIAKRFTNYELAEMIGATRETVNRMLAQFKKEGLIKYNHGRITILNFQQLKDICCCEECPLGFCRL